jgi:hypothetical protein
MGFLKCRPLRVSFRPYLQSDSKPNRQLIQKRPFKIKHTCTRSCVYPRLVCLILANHM